MFQQLQSSAQSSARIKEESWQKLVCARLSKRVACIDPTHPTSYPINTLTSTCHIPHMHRRYHKFPIPSTRLQYRLRLFATLSTSTTRLIIPSLNLSAQRYNYLQSHHRIPIQHDAFLPTQSLSLRMCAIAIDSTSFSLFD